MTRFLLAGAAGSSIIDRLWDAFMEMITGRMQSSAPTTVTLLQQADKVFLGPTADLTLHPAVQDVFNAMRVAGLILLAFCTVISLAEQAEAGITGNGANLVGWFKRFLVATLMTFGAMHVYGLWVRLFNGLLGLFRGYLDTHWTAGDLGFFYTAVMKLFAGYNLILVLIFSLLTLVVLFILWFMVGGIRQAELILSLVIAPIVWPLYLIQSVEDIPKTAFRGFLGLNAVLLFTVAMVRLAIRLAIGTDGIIDLWSMVPAIAMLVFAIFLPATIKRIVGQGQSGVGALVTAAQMAAGLKFLTLAGAGGGAAAAAAAPAAGAVPQAPAGASAYPLAAVPPSGVAGHEGSPIYEAAPRAARAFVEGSQAATPAGLPEPLKASQACIDVAESKPGSGKFNTITAIRKFQEGIDQIKRPSEEDNKGGEH